LRARLATAKRRCSRHSGGVGHQEEVRVIRQLVEEVVSWFRPVPSKVLPPDTSLLSIEGYTPTGFRVGIELLNDDATPMEFVVDVLKDLLNMDSDVAIETMLHIHKAGGVVLSFATQDDAVRVAEEVTKRARERSHPLVCRVAFAQQATAGDVRDARA
jgi:ATP-dependent Clp protease adapter protein ClpS